MRLQLQATYEALEELKHSDHSLQVEIVGLRRLLQKEEDEKHRLLCQLQAKDEVVEQLQCDSREVKSYSPATFMFPNDDFAAFENHTTGIGSKTLKKMGYEGKGWALMAKALSIPSK